MVGNDAPASFPLGTTLVTWRASDAAGNFGTATQSVTVTSATQLTASILVRSVLHSVGSGPHPGVSKVPRALDLKVFDRDVGPAPNPSQFGAIWNSGPGLVPPSAQISGPTLVPQGQSSANLYTILVAPGSRYLVIGRANVTCDGALATLYVGRYITYDPHI